ncbi:Lrp/AsnC family transcriptional regulator [bacterium]|nr:Lrp/AsnC family transcriptional regulator [bacterium]
MSIVLDKIDKHIIDLLQDDGRITNAQLAKMVGLSPPSMLERVRKLEKNGIIKKYTALVEAKKVGKGLMAFVAVSLRLHQTEAIEEFVADIQKIPEVLECHHITGESDYLMKVVITDMEEYERFLLEKLTHFNVVSHVRTSFILKSMKQETKIPIS